MLISAVGSAFDPRITAIQLHPLSQMNAADAIASGATSGSGQK
jgi:hypothetical protein